MDGVTSDLERRRAGVDETWTPVVAFVAAYCAAIALGFFAKAPQSMAAAQSLGLIAVVFATMAASLAVERRLADPALFGALRTVTRSFCAGVAIGAVAVATAHFAAVASSGLTTERGEGIPWAALALTVVPAVLHEELLFRGYAFQKLLARSPFIAVVSSAGLFAALHAGNRDAGILALANLASAGVLLGLVFVLYRSLWAPIGVHLSWNVVSGPVLGHEVSGWNAPRTLFELSDPGPEWITGGGFGIEASLWMTLVQIAVIAWLVWRIRNGPGFGPVDTIRLLKRERNPP